jgi:predicted transcriptional regulator
LCGNFFLARYSLSSFPVDNKKRQNQDNRSAPLSFDWRFRQRRTCITILVYNGVMPASNKVVRQTVGLPADTARRVRNLAKQRRLSANRIIVELVEEGIEAQKRKQKEFFELAERYRAATDPKDVARLGDDLGRMVFGD